MVRIVIAGILSLVVILQPLGVRAEEDLTRDGIGAEDVERDVESRVRSENSLMKAGASLEGGPVPAPGGVTLGISGSTPSLQFDDSGGRQKQSSYYLVPGRGLSDTLDSGVVTDQRSGFLNSRLGLLNATWMMIEPSIAQAMHNAVVQGESSLTNRYLAELTYVGHLGLLPHRIPISGEPYFECTAKYMAGGKKNDGKAWIEAQSLCANENFARGNQPFNTSPASSGAWVMADSAAVTGTSHAIAGLNANSPLLLSAILFDTDIAKAEEDGAQSRKARLEGYKREFIRYVGDVEYGVTDPDSKTPGYRKISTEQTKPVVQIEKLYRQWVRRLMKSLSETMNEYCEWHNRVIDPKTHNPFGSDPVFARAANISIPGGEVFWTAESNKVLTDQFLKDFNIGRWSMNAAYGDLLFELYLRQQKEVSAGEEYVCKPLVEVKVKGSDKAIWEPDTWKDLPEEEWRDYMRAYLYLSELVAGAKIYMRYDKIRNRVADRKAIVHEPARDDALEMINDVLRVPSLEYGYDLLLGELADFTHRMLEFRASEIGRGPNLLSDQRSGGNSGSAADNQASN